MDRSTKSARDQALGQRSGDAFFVTGCQLVAAPGATARLPGGARRAAAGDKLTKLVNTAGDDCAVHGACAVLYPLRLHGGSLSLLLGTYIA